MSSLKAGMDRKEHYEMRIGGSSLSEKMIATWGGDICRAPAGALQISFVTRIVLIGHIQSHRFTL